MVRSSAKPGASSPESPGEFGTDGPDISLEAETPAAIDALADREVVFEFKGNRLPFTASGFLTSFSLPNFHFHATTAYDILRSRGVPIGKRDYMGRMRIKR